MPLLLHYEYISKQLNNHNFSLQAILERIASSKVIHARMVNAKTEAVARATRHISGTFFAPSFSVLFVIFLYFFLAVWLFFFYYRVARGLMTVCMSDVRCIESQHEAGKNRSEKVLLAKVTHMNGSLESRNYRCDTLFRVRAILIPSHIEAQTIHEIIVPLRPCLFPHQT